MSYNQPYNEFNNRVPKPFILKNFGSDCCFNALLQSLISLPYIYILTKCKPRSEFARDFKLFLLQCLHIVKCHKHGECDMLNRIINISKYLRESLINSISKDNVLSINKQEDSQEFLIHLLENIKGCDCLNYLFEIKIQNMVKCESCQYSPKCNIESQYNIFTNDFNNIDKCVEYLNGYKCDKCKEETCRIYREIIKVGKIIIICLTGNYLEGKSKVNYDRYLNICDNEYELLAQIHHIGNSKAGHYYATVIRNNNIYIVDDDHIRNIKTDNIPIGRNVCLLFYHIK